MKLYLDNAATTPVRSEVLREMISSLKYFGNSESKFYDVAENAKKMIDEARNTIARCVGCDADEVVFTSGATESNNLVLKGSAYSSNKKTLIISEIEHSSVDTTAEYLESLGYTIIKVPVDKNGLIDLEFLKKAINNDTFLVSIIWVNNDTSGFPGRD